MFEDSALSYVIRYMVPSNKFEEDFAWREAMGMDRIMITIIENPRWLGYDDALILVRTNEETAYFLLLKYNNAMRITDENAGDVFK